MNAVIPRVTLITKGKATADVTTYQDVAWQIWPKQCHSLASLLPSSRHTMVACFRPSRAKKAVLSTP